MPRKKKDPLACVPKASAENAYELLEQVVEAIKEDPKRYNQHLWVTNGERNGGYSPITFMPQDYPDIRLNMPACGTMGCVAGWVSVMTKGPKEAMQLNAQGHAQIVLGITDMQAERLFAGHAAGERDHESPEAHAARGIRHIQRFMKANAAQLKAKKLNENSL
jgi:hypothetical protein